MTSFPLDSTTSSGDEEILSLTERVCSDLIDPERAIWDENENFPEHLFQEFKKIDLYAAMFDRDHGGLGLHWRTRYRIMEIMAEHCLGVATSFGASTGLCGLPIRLFGTDRQKKTYLPELASGSSIGAMACTEPQAGSDIFGLLTRAEKKGNRYLLNGVKQWITNAGRADLYCVFAITGSSKDPRAGISCFIVRKGSKGLTFGKPEKKLGIRCSPTAQVILSDVEVEDEDLVGAVPDQGFLQLIKTLTHSRSMVAVMSVGLARAAYRQAAKYAAQREQFGKPLIHLQSIQHTLADMLIKIESARLLAYQAGHSAVNDLPDAAHVSAMAKCHASEIAMQVTTDAVQIYGGYGFSREYPVEKMFRDSKILSIYEGANQVLKNQIALKIIEDSRR